MEGSNLRALIDDRRFQQYHEATLEPREFNVFDVLRNADYEIRHSNVIAWLLQPDDTHGLDGRFLRWFVDHLNERADKAGVERILATDYEASNIDVERELDYVDITVFFKREKFLIAIENKTEEVSPANVDQVRGYDTKLRDKYKNRYRVRSVLLTASRDGSFAQQGFVHVSWASVHREISALHQAGEFRSPVDAFVRQYVDAVGRRVLPQEMVPDSFKGLLDEYDALLKDMLDALASEGDDRVAAMVPADRGEFRNSVVRLVKDFRRQPEQLRLATRELLKTKGYKTILSADRARTEFWLYWEDSVDVEKSLGLSSCLRWGMGFWRRKVTVVFCLYQWPKKFGDERHQRMQALLEQLKNFISSTPVDRQPGDKYPMRDSGDYFYVYDRELVTDEELSGMSPSEAKEVVRERLEKFLSADDSDYRRIQGYFECLAFKPEAGKAV